MLHNAHQWWQLCLSICHSLLRSWHHGTAVIHVGSWSLINSVKAYYSGPSDDPSSWPPAAVAPTLAATESIYYNVLITSSHSNNNTLPSCLLHCNSVISNLQLQLQQPAMSTTQTTYQQQTSGTSRMMKRWPISHSLFTVYALLIWFRLNKNTLGVFDPPSQPASQPAI